jgi:ankyrin repeat protein
MSNNEFEYVYENEENNSSLINNNNTNKKVVTIENSIQAGNVKGVEEFLKGDISRDKPLLKLAVRRMLDPTISLEKFENYKSILRLLFKNKFYLNMADPASKYVSPLNIAAESDSKYSIPTMEFLLENGAPMEAGLPAIFSAIQSKKLDNLVFLVRKGANIESKTPYGDKETPLYFAVTTVNVPAVQYLLLKGAKLSFINMIGDNIFITILKLDKKFQKEKLEMIQLFLADKSLSPRFRNATGKNALMVAVDQGDLQAVKLLLNDQGFQYIINEKLNGLTVADLALDKSSVYSKNDSAKVYDEILVYLLSKRAVLRKDKNPILDAVKAGDIKRVEFALRLGFSIDPSALLTAVKEADINMIAYLITKRADINRLDETGYTPLTAAIKTGNMKVIKFLISMGADMNPPVDNIFSIAIVEVQDIVILKSILSYLIDELGLDPETPDGNEFSPLMIAAKVGKKEIVQFLLDREVNVDYYKDETTDPANPIHRTAYDVALNMDIRLLLAKYIEKDKPRFRGFTKDDFESFNLIFEYESPSMFTICPMCFVRLEHGGGCMYLFEHNCIALKTQWQKQGIKTLPIIHEKLYRTYKDKLNKLTTCIHCNRAGYTWTVRQLGENEDNRLVGHQHIELNSANPYIEFKQAHRNPLGNYYDRTTCLHEGGGGPREKFLRIQYLLNFMCHLNDEYILKISNERAHLLAREAFWDAPLDEKASPSDRSILDYKFSTGMSTDEIIAKIQSEKKFILNCKPVVLEEAVEKEAEKNYPNIPRYGTNAVDLAPIFAGTDGDTPEGASEPLTCFIQTAINLEDPHNDGRLLWGFRHRQPATLDVYDHYAKNELVCGPCLEDFLKRTFITDAEFKCFNGDETTCRGHFHPSELKGVISDELYESYRKEFNKNPPILSGGGLSSVDYPPLLGLSTKIEQNTCGITQKKRGGRKTRKGKRKSL